MKIVILPPEHGEFGLEIHSEDRAEADLLHWLSMHKIKVVGNTSSGPVGQPPERFGLILRTTL